MLERRFSVLSISKILSFRYGFCFFFDLWDPIQIGLFFATIDEWRLNFKLLQFQQIAGVVDRKGVFSFYKGKILCIYSNDWGRMYMFYQRHKQNVQMLFTSLRFGWFQYYWYQGDVFERVLLNNYTNYNLNLLSFLIFDQFWVFLISHLTYVLESFLNVISQLKNNKEKE